MTELIRICTMPGKSLLLNSYFSWTKEHILTILSHFVTLVTNKQYPRNTMQKNKQTLLHETEYGNQESST